MAARMFTDAGFDVLNAYGMSLSEPMTDDHHYGNHVVHAQATELFLKLDCARSCPHGLHDGPPDPRPPDPHDPPPLPVVDGACTPHFHCFALLEYH